MAPRRERVANNNALLLSGEGEQAAVAGYQEQQPLDRSWTQAAFRAFHEMRAGSPSAAVSEGNGIDREQGEKARQDGGKGPLAGFRHHASRKQQREMSTSDSAAVAREEEEGEEGEQSGKAHPPPPAACWHMRGRLTNTATGQTIALVEGVELARSLAFETAPSRKEAAAAAADKRQKKLRSSKVAVGGKARLPTAAATAPGEGEGELEVDKVLKPGLWTAFGALACSKFFMYQARTKICYTNI